MADWVTISALASAGGTLVLAGVTVASVRSANRAARVAEQSLLAGQRPLLVPTRTEDPAVKAGFQDGAWFNVPGGQGVAKATDEGLVLTSLMAKLRCTSLAERMHVPAFIFFFQMLYPFAWVDRADAATAAAAGGCMLVEANALHRAGGIDSIKGALIDDCALAARLKTVGRIWLGLTERVQSIRPYESFAAVKQMIELRRLGNQRTNREPSSRSPRMKAPTMQAAKTAATNTTSTTGWPGINLRRGSCTNPTMMQT